MNPYQYYNANNGQIADLSYNQNVKNMIDILTGGNVTVNPYNQGTDEYGQDTTMYSLNGYNDASKVGENKYSIGVDDPTTRGLFDVNVEIDPLTNKVKNLGTTYNSHTAFDWSKPAMFAALAAGGLMAAPYLGGASVLGEAAGGVAGGTIAGDAYLPAALATDSAFASDIAANVASGASAAGAGASATGAGTGATTGAGFGSGTSLSADASSNVLNGFYGTANPTVQANLGTVSNLVGGGAEANLASLGGNYLLPTTGAGIGGAELGATGGIIGSGAGLGQSTVPALTGSAGLNGFTPNDLMSQPASNYNYKPPQSKTQQMANALRLPTNANTNSPTYRAENPFYYSPQQQLANMLKV